MAIHLFSTPTQCTQCGNIVEDPTLDKCPNCGALLKERRSPSRLAGVDQRYGQIRFVMGLLRFLAVIAILVGILLFAFSDDSVSWTFRLLSVLGAAGAAAALFVIAGVFEVLIDVEENTRATFRIQQKMFDRMTGRESAHD